MFDQLTECAKYPIRADFLQQVVPLINSLSRATVLVLRYLFAFLNQYVVFLFIEIFFSIPSSFDGVCVCVMLILVYEPSILKSIVKINRFSVFSRSLSLSVSFLPFVNRENVVRYAKRCEGRLLAERERVKVCVDESAGLVYIHSCRGTM